MTEQEYKKNQMFKKLLKKMYEKGETESDIKVRVTLVKQQELLMEPLRVL